MKKDHIALVFWIVLLIISLVVYSVDFSSWDTITSSKQKQGKFVNLIAKLDRSEAIEYNPIKNPNYLSFYAMDSIGGKKINVIYRNSKPTDLERSESIVLKGTMKEDHFECRDILLKCPSKYKDNKQELQKIIN